MAKKLNQEERKEILAMANFCVCHSGDIFTYDSISENFREVQSFSLANVPKFDALLVIGGYPHPVVHAADILRVYERQYNKLPEFMTVGFGPNKGQKLEDTVAALTEKAMIMQGFDPEWIKKNHIDSQSTSTKGDIAEIEYIVKHSEAMGFKVRPTIAVVSEPGYLLPLAQELSFNLPQYEFVYYETPVTPERKRIFDCENLDAYGVDVILACVLSSLRNWNTERVALSREKMKTAPFRNVIRKYVGFGYNFYMYPEMLQELGYSNEDAVEMIERRREEVLGVNADGQRVGDPMPDADGKVFMAKVVEMINDANKKAAKAVN